MSAHAILQGSGRSAFGAYRLPVAHVRLQDILGFLVGQREGVDHTYLEAVQQVTLADIQEAARTYLQPSRSLRTILRAQK